MIIRCERVHAHDDAGLKGRPRGGLTGLDLALDAGVHAILGSPEDGSIALAEVLSGSRAPLRGSVRVGGVDPSKSAAARARVGSLGPAVDLPEATSVRASMEIAMRARGERSTRAEDLLAPLGLTSLLDRSVRSLRYVEARAVELALALTTPAPLLVALYEPLVDVAVQPLAAVRDRTRALASAGACVVVITSSPSDAASLADTIHILDRGLVVPAALGEAGAGPLTPPGSIAEIVVWVRDPDAGQPGVRELAAALSAKPDVRALLWEEHRGAGAGGSALRVRSDNIEACSAVIIESALETGAVLDAMAPVTPGLAEVRAAANALFARRGARLAALSGGAPPAPSTSPPAAPPPTDPANAAPSVDDSKTPMAAAVAVPSAHLAVPSEGPASLEASAAPAPAELNVEEPATSDERPTEGDPR